MEENKSLFVENYTAAISMKNSWTRMASTIGCMKVVLYPDRLIAKPHWFAYWLIIWMALLILNVSAQPPELPGNPRTRWIVESPEEVVTYLVFDPGTVADRLPDKLRFITIQELAEDRISWAADHLAEHPDQDSWGISFVEIIRADTFSINGREPDWGEQGAAGLWFARVAPADPGYDPGGGRLYLALEFWLPDRSFAEQMRENGYYASHGDVRLERNPEGRWAGRIKVPGLDLSCECVPEGEAAAYSSGGRQVIFPPAGSGVTDVVRIVFIGHKIQECGEGSYWQYTGQHPLGRGITIGDSTFQFGYDLIGGAYPE